MSLFGQYGDCNGQNIFDSEWDPADFADERVYPHPPDKLPKDFTCAPCPYCGQMPKLMNGEAVYPHRPDLKDKPFWVCWPCQAWCGCHPKTQAPLGTVANAALRKLRSRVHELLDPKWRGKKKGDRSKVYKDLRQALGISKNDCHVGKFTEELCQRAISILSGN